MTFVTSEMGFGPYSVTEISHSTVMLSDKISLAMKVWLPCSPDQIKQFFPYFSSEPHLKWISEIHQGSRQPTRQETFPTIMEYLPYSKDSAMTLERDRNRHPWFSSHGFVDLRVDIRGTGVSGGLYFDEYDEQELQDCVELIEWISSQPWSNRRVGMYGKSWGGFNGLQVAFKQPSALRAVISLYSTDNRFANDIHHEGDAMLGNGLLSWAGTMMALNARPPHPRYYSDLEEWKSEWMGRLKNAGQSWLATWLHHQHPRDPYWLHGSICGDMSKIKCPVLVIGGHADGYTNAALRMAGSLNEHSRAVIGPWSHQWPDVSIPGPNIDFLDMCLKWWSAHLKTGDLESQKVVGDWPRLQLFLRDSVKPIDIETSVAGTWVSMPSWDSQLLDFFKYSHSLVSNEQLMKGFSRNVYLGQANQLQFEPLTTKADPIVLKPHAKQGSGCGPWLAIDCGFPEDQNIANDHSECWISDVLDDNFVFAGLSKMFVAVEAQITGRYGLVVRVCDQFPSGESFLVTRGFKNLIDSDDGGWVKMFPGGTKKKICVDLKGVGQIIRRGHRLLISISPTYFPTMYPAVNSNGLKVYPDESFLHLQSVVYDDEKPGYGFAKPKPLLKLAVQESGSSFLTMKENEENGKYFQEMSSESGVKHFPSLGLHHEEKCYERYCTDEEVTNGDILANQSIKQIFELEGGRKVITLVETSQTMTGSKQAFEIAENMRILVDGVESFTKTWENIIPRKYI